ncbi:putative acetyltransferase [Gemmatimonas aurantiaca T-27]|uniref:Putative acetyltransferase n=1 Tax=Gemmatimonas aurantiaca (strain DSM 14586 / JCM 11422 / NBRC 100505 / T-27) TaxID=379066 RepID=C1ADV5_GEMAT|nr:putative acetyltransferase [Gemmatimonas aurantiaca T-27]
MPLVAAWFVAEWPDWYGDGGPGDAAADVAAFSTSPDALPLGVIAFEHGEPVGVAALKADSVASHRHLTPWAVAGYVVPHRRGAGIGTQLLAALRSHAERLGYAHVYCATSTAGPLLQRQGWMPVNMCDDEAGPLTVFVQHLSARKH